MDLYSYLAGVASTVAVLVTLLPWLRRNARFSALPAPSWPVAASIVVVLGALLGLWHVMAPAPRAVSAVVGSFQGLNQSAVPSASSRAGSMDGAIASLEARLARGGGSADDWELLAKSFEFLGRPADAAQARAHQLPPPPIDATTLTAALGRSTGAAPVPQAVAGAPAPSAPASPIPVLSAQSLQLLAQASAARRAKNPKAAAAIYATLSARDQLNADGWADYADTSASLQGNRLAGAPETYIARALALDPRHTKALWLKASADEEAQRWGAAVATWQALSTLLEPDSADARIVAANLQQDLQFAGGAASGAVVNGEVTITDALAAKASRGATLFIIARSADVPGPPLAVLRTAVGAWPLQFRLDDSLAMMPGHTLSSAGRIRVEARISQSGQAMTGSGDMTGTSGALSTSAHEPLKILIDRVQP